MTAGTTVRANITSIMQIMYAFAFGKEDRRAELESLDDNETANARILARRNMYKLLWPGHGTPWRRTV